MQKKCRLLIPSAKIVPQELQRLGKLPAVIYPINQRITFDYIYEQYVEDCSGVDIVCYENADKIERRLKSVIGGNVQLVKLPELRDLGYTIWFALQNITDSVIINFSDTIVVESISKIKGDAFFCQEDYMTDTWTYFDEKDGTITNVYDKDCVNEEIKKKLFVGIFKIMDAVEFNKCLEAAFENSSRTISSFYYALQLYSKSHPMTPVLTENWFDIGHADKYYNSKLEVKAREFNHITVDKNRGILKKMSDDKDKFIGEIKWYLKLPGDIEYVRPRIFSYSTGYDTPYVSMEYYAYHTVHELFLYGDLNSQQWEEIFERIRFICDDFKRYTVQDGNIKLALEDMYLTKTLQRLDKLKSNVLFKPFFDKTITVNGRKYKSLNQISKILEDIIPQMLYDVSTFNIIHGDLCFANIMIDSNLSFVKVIDPRGKFGQYDIYGDSRYELAKLFHSVDGKYDFIIKDLFEVDYNLGDALLTYKIQDRKREFDLYKVFLNVFKSEIGDDIKKIELIEALLFISMIPLHNESKNHQLVMLGTGLNLLNRVVDIEVKRQE